MEAKKELDDIAAILSTVQEPGKDAGNTIGGSIIVQLTSCLIGFDLSVLHIKTKIVSCNTADSIPVKQEVSGTVILPPLVFHVRICRLFA
jgi:hypothetical protein